MDTNYRPMTYRELAVLNRVAQSDMPADDLGRVAPREAETMLRAGYLTVSETATQPAPEPGYVTLTPSGRAARGGATANQNREGVVVSPEDAAFASRLAVTVSFQG